MVMNMKEDTSEWSDEETTVYSEETKTRQSISTESHAVSDSHSSQTGLANSINQRAPKKIRATFDSGSPELTHYPATESYNESVYDGIHEQWGEIV